MGEFTWVEDVALADSAVDLAGADLDDLFATAARALAALMVDPASVSPRCQRTVTATAPEVDLLLHDWLSELIFRKDRDHEVFVRVSVRVHAGPPASLQAELWGDVIEPGVTVVRTDPKAVTLHQLTVRPTADGWRARVVIDV